MTLEQAIDTLRTQSADLRESAERLRADGRVHHRTYGELKDIEDALYRVRYGLDRLQHTDPARRCECGECRAFYADYPEVWEATERQAQG